MDASEMSQALKNWSGQKDLLSARYREESFAMAQVAGVVQHRIEEALQAVSLGATTRRRVKHFEAFFRKLLLRAGQGERIPDAFLYMTDLVGLRVVTPFMEDITHITKALRESFELTEIDDKGAARSVQEFGYASIHLLLRIPEDLREQHPELSLEVVEVQVRTILQDAWAEVEHELVYKADLDVIDEQVRRKLLALNANLSLADMIFQELRDHQRARSAWILAQHRKLMDKVSTIPEKMGRVWRGEEPLSATEAINASQTPGHGLSTERPHSQEALSNMVLRALEAHVDVDLHEAVTLYTTLIEVQPTYAIYNHRGIAFFTMAEYERALADFSAAIELQPDDARAYTNRGLTHRMMKEADLALVDLNQSLKLNPRWADTLYARALTHYDLGNIPMALADCDGALALKPDFQQVLRFKHFVLEEGR